MDQETVENPVEQTIETESVPVEQETTEIDVEAPASETTSTSKVSETVPYDRFREVNEEKARAIAEAQELRELIAASKVEPEEVADLDQASRNAVRKEALGLLAEQKMSEFLGKNRANLDKSPLLDAAFRREMALQQAQGKMINPETAYENAERIVNDEISARASIARTEGLEEGKDVAKTKQQLGAVGETGKQPEFDLNSLSSTEMEKHLNLPRDDSYPSL